MDTIDFIKKYLKGEVGKNIIPIDPTRHNLSKIIKWTSSKYNEMSKDEVITDIINNYDKFEPNICEYRCGSYAQGNHNRGKRYMTCLGQHDNGKYVFYLLCDYGEDGVWVYALIGE